MVGFDKYIFDIKYIPLEGVDNRKFYATKRDPKAEEEIAKTNDEDDFSRRQADHPIYYWERYNSKYI